MSLYEKYHSQINIDHMFNVIKNILQEQFQIDINTISGSKDYFLNKMKEIFNENNVDDLSQLNKILLDHHIDYFRRNTQHKDITKSYNELLEERSKLQNQTPEPISDETSLNENKIVILKGNKSEKIEEHLPLNKMSSVQKQKKPETIQEPLQQIIITSGKRNKSSSSRYKYTCDIDKKLYYLSRLFIPLEDNYLFSGPILGVHIPEVRHMIHLERVKVLKNGNRMYGLYEPFEKKEIKETKDITSITIDIRDINDIEYTKQDIVKVNVLEIKEDILKLTCSSIHSRDFRNLDYIQLIDNEEEEKYGFLTSEPLQIKSIKENVIFCRLREKDHKTINDIDMKILNLSNQNIVYFN